MYWFLLQIMEAYDACATLKDSDTAVPEPLLPPASPDHTHFSSDSLTSFHPAPVKPVMMNAATQYERQPGTTRSVKCMANFLRGRKPPHRSKGKWQLGCLYIRVEFFSNACMLKILDP
jgi:hypothetical protein